MREPLLFTVMASSLGEILLAGTTNGLTHVSFQAGSHPLMSQPNWRRDDEVWLTAVSQLTAYFAGELHTFDLPLAHKAPRLGDRAGNAAIWCDAARRGFVHYRHETCARAR